MDGMARAIRTIDRINESVGRVVAWLTLATVLVCGTVVFLRYAFGSGYVWMQELYIWTHAMVFMLAAGYAYLRNVHVRVDIFYAAAKPRTKAWIDLLGATFLLLPWLILIAWTGWRYVGYSWATGEISVQSNGMPAIYVLKSAIVIFPVLLGLQGLAWIGRSLMVIAGHEPPAVERISGPLG
ncbi:MAG: TRAP transporter small permease subunit [Reyranellaceae bacterium]